MDWKQEAGKGRNGNAVLATGEQVASRVVELKCWVAAALSQVKRIAAFLCLSVCLSSHQPRPRSSTMHGLHDLSVSQSLH